MKIDTWKPGDGHGRAGFFVHLDDEHRLSIQWGSGMYGDNYTKWPAEVPDPSSTCEVYGPKLFGENANYGDPYGYVPVNKVMELLGRLACVNTPALWKATAQAWARELGS